MKELKRLKLALIHLVPGGSVTLKYGEKTILTKQIDKAMTVDEAVIFEVEKGDFGGAKGGIGGAVLESK